MEFKDYYKLLEIDRTATADVIKTAYRKLARKYHPDVSKEPQAEARFKEIGEAYEVLQDPERGRNLHLRQNGGRASSSPPAALQRRMPRTIATSSPLCLATSLIAAHPLVPMARIITPRSSLLSRTHFTAAPIRLLCVRHRWMSKVGWCCGSGR